jgi:hypothetical protein
LTKNAGRSPAFFISGGVFFHNVISVAQTALAIRLHDPFAPSICSIDVYQRLSAGDPDSGSPNDVRAFHGS